jgi:hypothetical protein
LDSAPPDRKRVIVMQTMEEVASGESRLEDELRTRRARDRWLGWLAGILAVAVVAMGAWLIFGDDGGQSLTAEQEQMIETVDQALVAWNAHDGEALAALYATDNGYHDNGLGKYYVRDGVLARYVDGLRYMNFSVGGGEHHVIGNYVVSEGYIPADSENLQLSIHAMSTDGTKILWHLAP